jgi:chromosome segregation ATPase
MRAKFLSLAALCVVLAAIPGARADEAQEARLRDALRQAVSDMRAAQDAEAQATAQAAQLQVDKAALQAQLDAAKAALAKSVKADDLKKLQDQLSSATAQNAQLASSINSYHQAAEQAMRAAETDSQKAGKIVAQNMRALATCKTANDKIISIAHDVLHLYETQGFRSILLKSYEPLLGTAKVDLENMVQDYDEKINDQEYVPAPGDKFGAVK